MIFITYYKLDPTTYMTAPLLAWDAMLLKTKVKLEVLCNLSMINTIETITWVGL